MNPVLRMLYLTNESRKSIMGVRCLLHTHFFPERKVLQAAAPGAWVRKRTFCSGKHSLYKADKRGNVQW